MRTRSLSLSLSLSLARELRYYCPLVLPDESADKSILRSSARKRERKRAPVPRGTPEATAGRWNDPVLLPLPLWLARDEPVADETVAVCVGHRPKKDEPGAAVLPSSTFEFPALSGPPCLTLYLQFYRVFRGISLHGERQKHSCDFYRCFPTILILFLPRRARYSYSKI